MKVEREAFKKLTIVIESQKDFDHFEELLMFVYAESPCGSQLEKTSDNLQYMIKTVS